MALPTVLDALNPIREVNGQYTHTPSTYEYELEDVSDASAGRTEDGLMHKNQIRQVVKLSLEWKNVDIVKVRDILQQFNHEYLTVKYLDFQANNSWITKTFYVGNRHVVTYNRKLNVYTITFNIIEQ